MNAAANANVPMHHRKYGQKDPTRRLIGWGAVIALHVLLLYGLITGTARKGLEIIKKPLEAVVIQEVIIPPPPPPPPKEIKPPEPKAPKVEAPPPPFVPPPEVTPPVTTAPTIQSVQTPPPAPPVIAPPPPPAPAPAPPAAPRSIADVCPTLVPPQMPVRARRDHISGTVRAQLTFQGGLPVKVDILSGPGVFHEAVRAAMMQYRCTGDGTAVQEISFKNVDE